VEIALKEAGIPYERCEVDFFNKPNWYLKNVNPAGKVRSLFRSEGHQKLIADLRFQ
jgi:glutathione S-transferase